MVADRERCHEEATRTAPCRPNPTDPGDAADLSIPQGYQGIRKIFSRDFFAPALTAGRKAWSARQCTIIKG
jgi:hypothetical protein